MTKTKVDIEKLKQDEKYFKLEVLSRLGSLYQQHKKEIADNEETIHYNTTEVKSYNVESRDGAETEEALESARNRLKDIYSEFEPLIKFLKIPDDFVEKIILKNVIHNQRLHLKEHYNYSGMPIAFSEIFDGRIDKLYKPTPVATKQYTGLKLDKDFLNRLSEINYQIGEAYKEIDKLDCEIRTDKVAVENTRDGTLKEEYENDLTWHRNNRVAHEIKILNLENMKEDLLRPNHRFVMSPEFYANQKKKQK